jgi:hypothetical protein
VTAALATDAASVEVRQAWPSDQAFVAATFREQLARQHGAAPYRTVDRVVDRILDSERTRVLVACEGKRLVGWLAYVEMPRVRAILFAYVRKDDRAKGVGAALADAAWPKRKGEWVHCGLRGGSTKQLLERYTTAIEMDLNELI